MGYPLGLPTVKVSDTEYKGVTPVGLQRIIGTMFENPGIVPGYRTCNVRPQPSWEYHVDPGAIYMGIDDENRRGVLIPVEGGPITVPPAGTSNRTDTIWVDKEGAIRVNAGASTFQAPGVVIGRFMVPAGAANLSAATDTISRVYAIPTGASLGVLHQFHDPATGVWGNIAPTTLGQGSFYLPSDRFVKFEMTHCVASEADRESIIRWRLFIDGVEHEAFYTHAKGTWPTINQMTLTKRLEQGRHTVHYVQDPVDSTSRFFHHKGPLTTAQEGFVGNFPGNRFEVWDGGPLK